MNAESKEPALSIKSRLMETLAKASPVLEAYQTQLETGRFSVDAVIGRAEDTWLVRNRMGPLCVGYQVVDPKLLVFLVPIAWRGEYLCNGTPALENTLFVNPSHDGFSTRGAGRDLFLVALNRARFVGSLAALEGVEPGEIHLHDGALQLTPESLIRLRFILGACLAELTTGANANQQHAIAEKMYSVLLEAYLAGTPFTQERVPLVKSYDRIVRAAEEHFMANVGARLSLADMCKATGVGRTVFYDAFNSVYGISPVSYFKKRRLMQARSELILATPDQRQVKEIALSLGLTHLGRFSTEYHALFGERPTTTLNSPEIK